MLQSIVERRRLFSALTFGTISLAGVVFLIIFILTSTLPADGFVFGLSRLHFAVAALFFGLLVVSTIITLFMVINRWTWLGGVPEVSYYLLSSPNGLYWILTVLYLTALVSGVLLSLSLMPLSQQYLRFGPFLNALNMLNAWLLLSSILVILFLAFSFSAAIRENDFLSPLKIILWGWLILAGYIFLVSNYRNAIHISSLKYFQYPLIWSGIFFSVWGLFDKFTPSGRYKTITNHMLLLGAIALATYVLYQHIAMWIGLVHETSKVYWDLLASEFLKGKLYLENPPNLHDLTLYNGRWYVAAPPLPALLMMPWVFFFGADRIDTRVFSIIFSSINSVLIYMILEQFVKRGWIQLSRAGILILVFLFAFGTNHLWVGIDGRFWFVSQIVTVTFEALAVLISIKSWSPWLVGSSLGLAILARPNIIPFWLFPLGITLQYLLEQGERIDPRRVLAWSIKSLIPVGLAVAGLLLYNYARFNNFLDFGYTNINGAADIVQNARTYGMFSSHFILDNIKVMFFSFPSFEPGGKWLFVPSTAGMSIFLSTPPILYLFRRYEKKWWIIGAWASVTASFVLLVMYHNTGADQFGYRYILDVVIPLIILLGTALGRKIPWHFALLTLVSIAINIYGAFWFKSV